MMQSCIDEINRFKRVNVGIELQCIYILGSKRSESNQMRAIDFLGPVVQKTKYLIVVKDRETKRINCLSLFDCICHQGKYKIIE